MTGSQRKSMPLSDALRSSAAELTLLCRQLGAVEEAMEALYLESDQSKINSRLASLQNLDLAAQSAAALSRFLLCLAHEVHSEEYVSVSDALNEVHLRDLANRLLGEAGKPIPLSQTEIF